jgi:tungstate transport system substrate-binding protein
MKCLRTWCGVLLLAVHSGCAERPDDGRRLILGATHTLEDSGLLPVLVAAWDTAQREDRLSVVVAGSGEILTLGRRGDVDVLLTHSPDDEVAFMAAGHGRSRQPVMHNEFVLLGPPTDPAGAGGASDVVEAMRRIDAADAAFVSRGDDSGTHRRERALWAEAQVVPRRAGYVEAGVAMADLLRLASQRRAYTLSDRATYEVLRPQLQLAVLQEGDPRLYNPYSVIVVTAAANPDGAERFARWLRDGAAQSLIAAFGNRYADDSPLFVADTVGRGRRSR